MTQMLKVSRIMVNRTNLPRSGTTSEVGGMISASSRKNTVRESRMEMESETYLRGCNKIFSGALLFNERPLTFSPLSEGR